ncbi:hypothetical protein K1719_012371 [Acacia pycnantha]|nr:hypothetical protein K1719_012371 [Acacia pycnantha]
MVVESEAKINMTDWSSQTNWTIASGSLQECITFESSLSLANEGGDEVEATTLDSVPKSSLILYPASADSGPCEIKISFAQKHESSNEYLCTIRCGVAARDGEILHALNVEEVVSSNIKGFNKELAEENIRSEDDWVDVKFPDSPGLDGGNHGLQTKSSINSAKSYQDLFEATAEISDVTPCTSVTLRLLSLQNKSYIYIEEIYVFGDPADSERQESSADNSSSNSLMTMFLPTLMQLSQTTALRNIKEKYPPVGKEKQYFPEVDSGKSHPCDSLINTQLEGRASKTDHQEGELQKVNEESVGPSQSDVLLQDAPVDSNLKTTSQAALMESNQSETPSQAAKTKINDCDTPPEAAAMEKIMVILWKMLMPISSIEARLQQVEQQLETLTIKLQNSGLPSCSKIHAPDGSCIQSDANSCDNCHVNNATEGLMPDKNVSHIEELSISPNDTSDSANTTQLHPGLIVTAPEFLDAEDEEENKVLGLETTSNDKQRQHLSIDDAVASAFAGFLSSASTPRYTKSLVVRAPEFVNEDDHENDDASPRNSYEIENNDKESEVDVKESEEFCQHSTAEDDQKEVRVEAGVLAEHDPGMSSEHTAEDNESRNIIGQINYGLSSTSNIPELCQTDSIYSSAAEGEVSVNTDHTDIVATEVSKKASHEDIIENVLGFSRGSSVVNFETSILDVKFISQGNHVTKSFLEALVDTPETTSSEDHPVEENSDDLSINEQFKTNETIAQIKTILPLVVDGDNLQERKRKRREEDIAFLRTFFF